MRGTGVSRFHTALHSRLGLFIQVGVSRTSKIRAELWHGAVASRVPSHLAGTGRSPETVLDTLTMAVTVAGAIGTLKQSS